MDIKSKETAFRLSGFNSDLFYGPTHMLLSPFLLGFVSVPNYPFEKNRAAFVFNSLLTKAEVIAVLSRVREECNRVAEMSLFYISFTKSLRLEEFESAQSQKHAQVKKTASYTYTYKCTFHHTLSLSSYRSICFCKSHGWLLYVMAFHLICTMRDVAGTTLQSPAVMFTACLNCVA